VNERAPRVDRATAMRAKLSLNETRLPSNVSVSLPECAQKMWIGCSPWSSTPLETANLPMYRMRARGERTIH
jgi:hypothetical protein